jgi:Rap1a immunity proteins
MRRFDAYAHRPLERQSRRFMRVIQMARGTQGMQQMKRWLQAAALCAVVSIGTGRAAVTEDSFLIRSTGDLVDLCSAAQPDPLYTASINFCHGFGVGVFRVLEEQDMARRSRHMFCLPNPALTRNEALASFLQWAKANPNQMAQPAADGIAQFLIQTYPCQRGH